MFRRQKWQRAIRCSLVLIFLFFLTCLYLFNFFNWRYQWYYPNQGASRGLLCAAMPVMAWIGAEGELPAGPMTSSVSKLLAPLHLDRRDPLPVAILKLSLPYLTVVDLPDEEPLPGFGESFVIGASSAFPEQPPEVSRGGVSGDSLVIIYHTHTGETYALTDGRDRLEGKCGGVVQAGAAVKEVLENRYGVKVVHSEKIHDAEYDISYRESEKTLRKLLSENKKAKVVLDIHRDAGRPRKNSLVNVNGWQLAPVLLVVGSDARLPFPTWEKNHQFAVTLAERLNEKYPGLCLGVRIKDGRYNQFLHPRAILVEIGSVNNSTEEAVAGARLFADVLGEMIMDMLKTGE